MSEDESIDENTDETPATGDGAGSETAPHAQTVLTYLVRQLVEDPDSVEIDVDERGHRPALNVHVAPGDMGRVIGKRGRVAQSIRTVVRAAAVRDDVEIDIEFVD